MGIDIGSEDSKGVIVKDGELLVSHVLPSTINYNTVAQKLRERLLAKSNLGSKDIAYTIATGYGASSVFFANEQVSGIACCARGINSLFPSARTIIDIGGTTTQIIRLDKEGKLANFVGNNICAGGSAYLLKIVAHILQIDIKDIGPLSLKSNNPISFSTGCAVFGETEAITRVTEGFSKEDIIAGAHKTLVNAIFPLIVKAGSGEQYAISGGPALDIALIKDIEEKLRSQLLMPPQPQVVTALGAAIIAKERYEKMLGHTRPKISD